MPKNFPGTAPKLLLASHHVVSSQPTHEINKLNHTKYHLQCYMVLYVTLVTILMTLL